MNIEQNGDTFSITSRVITQIVKEQDEYTTKMIEDYIRERQAKGECILSTIIPEGKLRHIINLGITTYNEIQKEPKKLSSRNYFSETAYNEYLHQENLKLEKENQRLRNRINIMEDVSGLRSIDTNIDFNEGGEKEWE